MLAPQPFALEAERLVERERRLVPGKDVQLELAHARLARPGDRLLEQGAADPAPAVAGGDHQPEVGDVAARRMRVAREREPADELAVRLGDEDGRVRVALQRPEIAPFLRDAAPAVRGQEPGAFLRSDRGAELDELRGVLGPSRPDGDAQTTIPWPPRRGSPAASSVPSARSSTAETPPK